MTRLEKWRPDYWSPERKEEVGAEGYGGSYKRATWKKKKEKKKDFLAVQWLRLCASTARDLGLIPGQGTNIPKPEKKKKSNSRDR